MRQFMYGDDGDIFYRRSVDISEMMIPVRCLRCHDGIYDLTKVEVTARYIDCSMWKTPCCDQLVDDLIWTGRAAYVNLDRNGHDERR